MVDPGSMVGESRAGTLGVDDSDGGLAFCALDGPTGVLVCDAGRDSTISVSFTGLARVIWALFGVARFVADVGVAVWDGVVVVDEAALTGVLGSTIDMARALSDVGRVVSVRGERSAGLELDRGVTLAETSRAVGVVTSVLVWLLCMTGGVAIVDCC